MQGRDPACTAALSTRTKDCEVNLLPLSIAGQIDQKGAKGGDFSTLAWSSCAEWRVQVTVCSGLGTVHMRLFKATLSALPQWNRGEGKVAPRHHLLQKWERGEDLQNWLGWLNNPAGGISSTRERQEECLKGPIMNTPQGDKLHGILGPYFTEAIKAGSSESRAKKGIQGSAQPLLTHRAAIYTKQVRADTLTQIVPCPTMKQLFNQKLYIIGNKQDRLRWQV